MPHAEHRSGDVTAYTAGAVPQAKRSSQLRAALLQSDVLVHPRTRMLLWAFSNFVRLSNFSVSQARQNANRQLERTCPDTV